MTAPEVELRRVWHRVAGRRHDAVIEAVCARHREPHRRYHTATHVMWVCRHVTELGRHHPVDDLDAVLAAAIFHDAVYDPRSTTNEADSAALAVRALAGIGWDPDRCRLVAALVMATADHRPTTAGGLRDTTSDDVLLDADLAILGGGVSEYSAYVAGVRAEYAHVDDEAWATGRAQVLQQFLARPAIFRTATMHAAREHRARANLAAEVVTLQRSTGSGGHG